MTHIHPPIVIGPCWLSRVPLAPPATICACGSEAARIAAIRIDDPGEGLVLNREGEHPCNCVLGHFGLKKCVAIWVKAFERGDGARPKRIGHAGLVRSIASD